MDADLVYVTFHHILLGLINLTTSDKAYKQEALHHEIFSVFFS